MSCCGAGGSWFGNCGSAGSTQFGHTWYEGLQACKSRQSNQQLHASHDRSIGVESKAVVAAHMFAVTSIHPPTMVSYVTPITVPTTSTSIVPARTLASYDADKSSYEAVIATAAKMTYTSVYTSAPKVSAVDGSITLEVNKTLLKPIRTASGGMTAKTLTRQRIKNRGRLRNALVHDHNTFYFMLLLSLLVDFLY